MSFAEYFLEYGHHWALELVVLVAIIAVATTQWKRFIRFSVSHMLMLATMVWLCGFGLYIVGFAYEGTAHSMFTILMRSAIASIKMFIADNELIEISSHYKEDPTYMVVFSAVHFLAFCTTTILVLNTLGKRLRSNAILMKEMHTCKRKARHSYVFWDVNSPSIALAKDIRNSDSDARIISIRPFGIDALGEKLEVTQILNAASLAHELGASSFDEIESVMTVQIPREVSDSRRMKWLRRILESSSDVDFFFLTPDSDANLMIAQGVVGQFSKTTGKPARVHILTKAGPGQAVVKEHLTLHEENESGISWNFLDMHSLSVESLKYNIRNYPVFTFPDDKIHEGKVEGEFNALILGTGETGKAMFRFLYGFSLLEGVGTGTIDRKFILLDKDVDVHAGDMLKDCPEIASSAEIEISNLQVGSLAFWEMIRQNAGRLNCISLALGDDELDLKLARDLYRHIVRYGAQGDVRTKIFVKVYTSEYMESFRTLAAEYNGHSDIEIIPFGGDKEIFRSGIILKSNAVKVFKEFNYNFDVVRGKDGGLDAEECWKADFSISKFSSEYDDVTTALDELERRKEQCISSTFYIGTLLKLAGMEKPDKEKIAGLLEELDSADGTSDRLVDILVRSCYLREKVSHQLLGFTACSNEFMKNEREKAMRQKKTPYLLPWNETSGQARKLFTDMLKTSLEVASKYESK